MEIRTAKRMIASTGATIQNPGISFRLGGGEPTNPMEKSTNDHHIIPEIHVIHGDNEMIPRDVNEEMGAIGPDPNDEIVPKSNNNDRTQEIINIMAPIMDQTMKHFRDILSEARRNDTDAISQAISSSLPALPATMAPILKDAMNEISHSIKGAMTEVSKLSKSANPPIAPLSLPIDNMNSTGTTQGRGLPKCDGQEPISYRLKKSHNTKHNRDSSSEADTEREDVSIISSPSRMKRISNHKLPIFTGKDWKAWINRFEYISHLNHWSDQRKLAELLPRLQGAAGEFVYGQLSRVKRSQNGPLEQELEYRFRKVKTARTYDSQFSNRNQKQNECVEDFAAELKALYDKAYPNRDRDTRREDLLRRFQDGLIDERVQMQVEYVKEPIYIDQAVYEVVNYIETRKRGRKDKPGPQIVMYHLILIRQLNQTQMMVPLLVNKGSLEHHQG